MDPAPVIGIDLGTTNSAVAWSNPRGPIKIFEVLQLVAPGETQPLRTLPSFLYLPDESQRDSGAVRLPWDPAPAIVAGVFAREEGALVPARQVSSSKSWLSNPHVDRTAPLLPWSVESARKLSPVEASSALLAHLRDAWHHAQDPGAADRRLEQQQIVLTVPASFDEEARELTVRAAQDAGLTALTLLEEPLAALYAWISTHRRALTSTFGSGAAILVCDVGGGTTDFSLIRARADDGGELTFERIAIGEHLLLGGDNLDLALAVLVEQKLGEVRLTLMQRQILRRKCSAAKERLLSGGGPERVPITVLGAGRGLVGGGMTTELTRDEVVGVMTSGFLPVTDAADLPARERRPGLRELGLPYETEPAITRHLAAFLTRAAEAVGSGSMARPDAVLFNGGFFAPALAREAVLDALEKWFGRRPLLLENAHPETAVAVGAAFYGRLRRDPAAARHLIIRAGSARSYYLGVDAATGADAAAPSTISAIALMTRGTDEGTSIRLDRQFTVTTNQPAAFTLYSSTERADAPGALITLAGGDDTMLRHAPLVTAFRYGKRSRRVPLGVRLVIQFTETGTLELWCESTTTDHRWRLAFNLRGVESDPLQDLDADAEDTTGIVIADQATDQAAGMLRGVFGPMESALGPDALVAELETTLGHGKQAWPLATIRRLTDVLLETAAGRARGPAFEARWLNLTGFCVRPGFGSASDEFRVSELRKVYMAGLHFPKEVQNQVEWLVLWQRVAAGFNAGQQRELAHRVSGGLGLSARKPPRLNAQIERESWRLLASLERLDAGQRVRLGDELLTRIRREPRNPSWLWSLGRLGARSPLYGPLNAVVPVDVAERWMARLLELKDLTSDAAAAVADIGARTDDPARDIAPTAAAVAIERLEAAGYPTEALRRAVPPQRRDVGRVFGESLPAGLKVN